MRKIPTLFLRDPDDMRRVTTEVHPDCRWVMAGEGVMTRKYDGTGVMLDDDGKWWSRREVKPGKAPPAGFVQLHYDVITGKAQGYEPIEQSPFYKFFKQAIAEAEFYADVDYKDDKENTFTPGTYELCGPKIQGNAEGYDSYVLVKHENAEVFTDISADKLADIEVLRATVIGLNVGRGWEGIVWHHPDGRMAKLKARDFPRE